MKQLPDELYPTSGPAQSWDDFVRTKQHDRLNPGQILPQEVFDRWDVAEHYCAAGRRTPKPGEKKHETKVFVGPERDPDIVVECAVCGAPLAVGGLVGWGKHRAYAAWFSGVMKGDEAAAFESSVLKEGDLTMYVLYPTMRRVMADITMLKDVFGIADDGGRKADGGAE